MSHVNYKKRCNNCNKEQCYKTIIGLNIAIKNDTYCKSCSNKITANGKHFKSHSEKTKKVLRIKALEQFKNGMPTKTRLKIRVATTGEKNPFFRKRHSEETKFHWRKIRKGQFAGGKHPMYGKHHSAKTIEKIKENMPDMSGDKNPSKRPEVRKKLRLKAIERMNRQNVVPSYNENSIPIIENYGKENGYNFQHATNGGEVQVIGYFVDGYDKEKNVVIEYYEKWHKRQIERDERRKQEIVDFLNCKFIILKETKVGYDEYIYNNTQ